MLFGMQGVETYSGEFKKGKFVLSLSETTSESEALRGPALLFLLSTHLTPLSPSALLIPCSRLAGALCNLQARSQMRQGRPVLLMARQPVPNAAVFPTSSHCPTSPVSGHPDQRLC